jgi:hypothetical protein
LIGNNRLLSDYQIAAKEFTCCPCLASCCELGNSKLMNLVNSQFVVETRPADLEELGSLESIAAALADSSMSEGIA